MAFASSAEAVRELVVLTHGFMGGRVQFLPIAASLARQYDVLNFGYRSRAQSLKHHSHNLIDVVGSRLARKKQRVHFVTHSFGANVVRHAYANGLADTLGEGSVGSRCVFIGPPLRGASFARAFQQENVEKLIGKGMVGSAVYSAARAVLGEHCGNELMMNDERWFEEQVGVIPDEVGVLVIAGRSGKLNPLIDGDSDGVVGVEETVLRRHHFRMEVRSTHNLMLYMPQVLQSVTRFVAGEDVGRLVDREGNTLEDAEAVVSRQKEP